MTPPPADIPAPLDALVIGAGQAGLAAGYHLRRAGLRFLILEAGAEPGGSWRRHYDSLTLFSTAAYSSLPGLPFPGEPRHYPVRDEVAAYLADYARHFALPIRHSTPVAAVRRHGAGFAIQSTCGETFFARAVIAATGPFRTPQVPEIPGRDDFRGECLHSSAYRDPARFRGRRVVVVGAGNSAVQIAVELAREAEVTLATRAPVKFLPARILGRELHFWLKITGIDRFQPPGGEKSPVIDSGEYRAALAAGRPPRRAMFTRFTPDGVAWPDGCQTPVDAVIFGTGYRQEFPFLARLPEADRHRRGLSRSVPGLYFVGLSNQSCLASATLRGVGRDAAHIVRQLQRHLRTQTEMAARTF